MNTLYEILEVSENASKEVIEKAYKVLAKKYHPDLQTTANKQMAEDKMKQINDAYDILSDDVKRKEYDESLKEKRDAERQRHSQTQFTGYNNQSNENVGMSQGELRYHDMQRRKYEEELRRQQERMQKNIQQQYENAYYSYLRSLGYKIKERWTWEKTKKLLIILLILVVIILVLWFLPPTHQMMMNIYEDNKLLKVIIDIIVGIIGAFFQTIGSVFQGF